MKNRVRIILLLGALLVGVLFPIATQVNAAAPASHSHARPAFLDKTRFVAHMGLAFYAFHHFVYAKWQSGAFRKGAPGRVKNIIKAAIAVLFAYHEVKVAYGIAQGSHSKVLHALVSPINAFLGKANSAYTSMKSGNFNDSLVTGMSAAAAKVSGAAKAAGYGFKDIPVSVPGL